MAALDHLLYCEKVLFAPCIFHIWCRVQNTSMKESLDEVTDTSRDDIDSKAGKEERGELICAKFFSDGSDEAVDLFEIKDNVVLIGEVAVIWFMLSVSCGHCH